MDLFVLDTVGEQTALEDRIVPKLSGKRKPILGQRKTSAPQQLVAAEPSHEQHSDEDTDDDDDEDDDADDKEIDAWLKLRVSAINIGDASTSKKPAPAKTPAGGDTTWQEDAFIDRFVRKIACLPLAAASDDEDDDEVDEVAATSNLLQPAGAKLEPIAGKSAGANPNAWPNPSEKNKKKLRKLEASKTKGTGWYNMPATEMTDEIKRDLELIQMRSVLDPKHFYKKNDLKALPKYFQVGKVLPSPLDHYAERGQRTSKKKTIVDELMADAQFQRFNKRKYTEVVEEKKRSGGYQKAHSKMKKLKKNK